MEDGPTVPYRKELSFVETCSPLRKQEKSKSTLLGGSTSHKAMSNVEKKMCFVVLLSTLATLTASNHFFL